MNLTPRDAELIISDLGLLQGSKGLAVPRERAEVGEDLEEEVNSEEAIR